MTATSITNVRARRVFDSRGRPTVEAEVVLSGGTVGRAIAPAGASRGSREAIDLRDGGQRFGGHDVAQAIANVNGPIRTALFGSEALAQAGVDAKLVTLDGTPNKAKLGASVARRRFPRRRARSGHRATRPALEISGWRRRRFATAARSR